MSQAQRSRGKGRRKPAVPHGPIRDPLDVIAADHAAERDACLLIERIVRSGDPLPDDVKRVVSFLFGAFRQHLLDEEEDLFPLLCRRCEPEDEIEKIIGLLRSEHRHPRSDYCRIIEILETAMAGASAMSANDRRILADYALCAQRHLSVENAIILPLARARLTRADLARLRRRMLERRCGCSNDAAR